ncbi:MAG TPA: hypothetical protein VGZ48_06480, partial [Candidatus Acidoferrales bacterium]|nr:hypothetical protein [Candidatus Acidoferrales bacterium]
ASVASRAAPVARVPRTRGISAAGVFCHVANVVILSGGRFGRSEGSVSLATTRAIRYASSPCL